MLSKQQYLNDKGQHWMPHLMFYFPRGDGAKWGAGLAGSPTVLNPQFQDLPEAISVILVPVAHWRPVCRTSSISWGKTKTPAIGRR
jgi:hypothetical protein